jgi:hypothetical protein
MGHLIDFKLQSLGEKSISSSTGYYTPTDDKDNYVQSDVETYARIQRLREVLLIRFMSSFLFKSAKTVSFVKIISETKGFIVVPKYIPIHHVNFYLEWEKIIQIFII